MPSKNMGYYFMIYPLTERTLDCDSNMSTDTTFLCSVCKQVVQPTSSDSTSEPWITPPDQTLDAFRKAVLRDCFICSKLWNLSELHRIGWESLDPQLWRPLSFRVDKEYYQGKDILHQIRVMILFRDPTQIHSERSTELRLRLIPSSEREYEDLFSFNMIDESTGSTGTLDLARSWFSECFHGHDQCKRLPTSAVNWLPTRLVDIGSRGETTWKLVVTSENSKLKRYQPRPQYMTLSYRWGTEPQKLVLSSHNLDLLGRGSPIVQLPQTFQDLVVVAHHLGIRYVWIDCLCIIQDSRNDWEKEALKMREVYTNAACNVAASASSSPAGGLFRSRVTKDIRPAIVKSNLSFQEPGEFYMFDKGYWDRHLLNGALHTRGWVFQERFLSPRQIYFTKSQVMWECLEEHKCEGFPRGIPLHDSSKSIKRLLSPQRNDDETKVEGLMPFDTLDLWIDIVATYSKCEFSVKEDKLYALGGIAKLFQEVTGDTYLAGLWRSRLLHQLDWYTLMPHPRIMSKYRAPSWSWASVDGPVQLRHPAHGYHFLAEVMDASVTTTSAGNDLVNVIGGSITLRAKVYDANYEREYPLTNDGLIHFSSKDKAFPPFTTWPYLDAVEDNLKKSGHTSLLPLRNQEVSWEELGSDQSGETNDVTCLILEKVGASKNTYRKIGWIYLGGEMSHGKENQDIIDAILSAHESDRGWKEIILV